MKLHRNPPSRAPFSQEKHHGRHLKNAHAEQHLVHRSNTSSLGRKMRSGALKLLKNICKKRNVWLNSALATS